MTESGHIPVLCREAVETLHPLAGKQYLDGTFGGGGYARAILSAAPCRLFAMDRDPAAVDRGLALAAINAGRLTVCHGRIGDLLRLLAEAAIHRLDGAVFDLGTSSYQLDDGSRGFSFRRDGPLDMRMGASETTAAALVNSHRESDLSDILFMFGEEKAARRVARAIVARREIKPFATTMDLADVIRSVVRPDKSGIDPATRSFQALRIAINEELVEISAALEQASRLLTPGGRLVVVSFHSLEDRLVKTFFAAATGAGPGASRHDPAGVAQAKSAAPRFRLLTRTPVRPADEEIRHNPRARSARLRAIERLAA